MPLGKVDPTSFGTGWGGYPADPELMHMMQAGDAAPVAPGTGNNPDPYGLSSNYPGGPNGIPNSAVPQEAIPPELAGMIAGQGYSPEVLAMMRASATEDVSHGALPGLSQLNRGLSAAGQYNSPAGAAMRAVIGRQTGDAQSAAQRDLTINNAMVGNQNRQFGLNYAHQIAVENMNRMFQSMSQNLSESGANTRAAAGIAFGTPPFNPGSGSQSQQSPTGQILTGAAQAIPTIMGGTEAKPTGTGNDLRPQQSFAPPQEIQTADFRPKAFGQNPYRGF